MRTPSLTLPPRLQRVKTWKTVAALLALVLAVYLGLLGVRYVQASRSAASLTRQAEEMGLPLRRQAQNEDAAQEKLAAQEQNVDLLRAAFTYANTDSLVALVAGTADHASLEMLSVTVGDTQFKQADDLVFQAQPLTVMLQGPLSSLSRFLVTLHERAPAAQVSSVRLSNLDTTPLAQVQLLFLLSPKEAPPKKASK
ncbi:MAG: hypothetical protein HYX97_01715 [Chloroflexi bacterium]|nr:hypothetical protein [Chloroflexota bacterium]